MAYICTNCEFRITDAESGRIKDYNDTCPACRLRLWKNFKHKDLYSYVQDNDYVGEKGMRLYTIGKMIVKVAVYLLILASIIFYLYAPKSKADNYAEGMKYLTDGMIELDKGMSDNILIMSGIHNAMTNRNASVDATFRVFADSHNQLNARLVELEASNIRTQVD